MTPPGRHLRAVPDPDRGAPVPAGTTDPQPPDFPGLVAPRVPVPGDSFLDLVDAAGMVAPLHGDIADLSADELLAMLGGPPSADAPTSALAALGEEDRGALLGRLSVAAWDVIRAGAADHDPVLHTTLVQVCTRLEPPPTD